MEQIPLNRKSRRSGLYSEPPPNGTYVVVSPIRRSRERIGRNRKITMPDGSQIKFKKLLLRERQAEVHES